LYAQVDSYHSIRQITITSIDDSAGRGYRVCDRAPSLPVVGLPSSNHNLVGSCGVTCGFCNLTVVVGLWPAVLVPVIAPRVQVKHEAACSKH